MLIYKSNIKELVHDRVRGQVCRIGGTVDQLVGYEDCATTDINLVDGGFGRVVTKNIGRGSLSELCSGLKRLVKQEVKHMIRGSREPLDRRTIIADIHAVYQLEHLRARYDAVISSNVIEHSPNPLLFLLNLHFLGKESAVQFHAIPHYKYTFDVYRNPTPIDHIIEDFERGTGFNDRTHDEDYTQSAIVRHGWQREFHRRYPVTYPYMHFHVFDEHNVKALFEYVFCDVTNDILRTERYSDNVVLCSNRLNARFIDTHRAAIRRAFGGTLF